MAFVLPVVVVLAVPSIAVAGKNGNPTEANGEVGLDVGLGPVDFSNPGSAEPGYCDGNEDYPIHISESTGTVKDANNTIGIEQADGRRVDLASIFTTLPSLDLPTTFTVKYVFWRTVCAKDAAGARIDGATLDFNWVAVPDPQSIVPGLLEPLLARLPAPDVTWHDADREFGWLYVNAPMDFRIEPSGVIREELTITNVAGTATGWVQATPDYLVFDPGEPKGQLMSCSYDDAIAPYSIRLPGRCSYTYQQSSAVSPTATFRQTLALAWAIDSSAPLTINQPVSSSSQDMAVAEIQAVVTR